MEIARHPVVGIERSMHWIGHGMDNIRIEEIALVRVVICYIYCKLEIIIQKVNLTNNMYPMIRVVLKLESIDRQQTTSP